MACRCAVVLLLLAGCASYDPPMAGDHASLRYQQDLERCHKQASAIVARANNASPQTAVRGLFAAGEPEREQTRVCMQSRGYHLVS